MLSPPASRRRTEVLGSSDSLLARMHPPAPAPTITFVLNCISGLGWLNWRWLGLTIIVSFQQPLRSGVGSGRTGLELGRRILKRVRNWIPTHGVNIVTIKFTFQFVRESAFYLYPEAW